MIARRVPGILPPLSFDEALDVTAVHSVAGLVPAGSGLVSTRPFRAPHHTISNVALIGGGSQPRPGEVSLAHHGVLFLDELLEFHLSHGEWVRLLREQGFEIVDLIEIQAPEGAETHLRYDFVTAEWARKWPSEEIWRARKR